MTVALQFARLLNQARIYVTEDVDACSECKAGILLFNITHPDVGDAKKGDPCPFCFARRQFLERCTQEVGPIVIDSREMAPAVSSNIFAECVIVGQGESFAEALKKKDNGNTQELTP